MVQNRRRRRKPRRRINKRIFHLIAAITCLLSIYRILRKEQAPIEPTPTVDSYNPNAYLTTNFRLDLPFYSYEDETYSSLVGIDVSYVQEHIDWAKVHAQGISFAIIRAGYRGYQEGGLHTDAYFEQNMNQTEALGIPRGVYWVSHGITEAEIKEEAQYVQQLIQGYELQLPIMFDMEYAHQEDRIRTLSRQQKTQMALTFVREMKQAGHKVWIYGSPSWLRDEIDMTQLQDEADVWLASYHVKAQTYPYEYRMWQYSDQETLDGIQGKVDLNLYLYPKDASPWES